MKQAQSHLIAVHVLPRSRTNAIEGLVKDAAGKEWLKVRITAAPESGKANASLLKLLATAWGCAPSSLSVASGTTARRKMIRKS